jgi:hypothetical protein
MLVVGLGVDVADALGADEDVLPLLLDPPHPVMLSARRRR